MKKIIDVLMCILLIFLMAYTIIGQKLHELLGTAMLVLFIVHNILNYRWYSAMFKGKYSLRRIIGNAVNILMLVAFLGLAVSGVMMSGYVFGSLNIKGGQVFARILHMLSAYWGFILISMHIGLHWSVIAKGMLKNIKNSNMLVCCFRVIAFMTAMFGAYAFYKNNISDYLFLKTEFVFFDTERSLTLFVAEHLAIMELFVFITYYAMKALSRRKG